MDTLNLLLNALGVTFAGAQVLPNLYNWLTGLIRDESRTKKADEIQKWLRDLGLLSEESIRQAVENWAASQESLSDAQLEELIGLLVNLAKGARFVTTAGTPRSSYLRNERLLDQLLNNLQPACRKGERVGAWELERFLGMGSFGEVWRARNPDFPEPRAYKFFTQEDALASIRLEQKNLAAIHRKLKGHPNIIEFLDVAIEREARPYLALEYVGGGSLEDWVLEDPANRVALDKAEIIRGITAGLAKAHEQRIYHRDIKPANILLTTGSEVQAKIADFGLGQVKSEGEPVSVSLASRGLLVGTNLYLPPEALVPFARRDPAQDDVFALGVLWYQLEVERLERPPYDFFEQLRRADVHPQTIRLISRCLAHPERRFADACALEDALRGVLPDDDDWKVPEGCFDVRLLARAYLKSLTA